ncbi:MAG: hypothetical protein ACRD5K_08530 [Candidatus Acidiferrales bacterium]
MRKYFGRFIVVGLVSAVFVSAAPAQASQDFKRPAPTAASWAAIAKLPAFTGVWEMPLGDASLVVQPGAAERKPRQAARRTGRPAMPKQPTLDFTPAWVAKLRDLEAHPPQDNPQANCVPNGMPDIMAQPYPYEFLLTPGQVTIIGEAYRMIRHIYTDGRPLPKDPAPTFWGTSVGHWDGNTLVAETVGLLPQTDIIPGSGIEHRFPHSGKMKIIERYRLLDPDTMSIQTTVIDPVVLTSPYTTTQILKRHRDWTIDEYICEQNNRNALTSGGKAQVDTTPPPPPEPNLK